MTRVALFFGLLSSARAACDAACYSLPSTPSAGRAADRAALCATSPPQNASAIGSRVAAAVYALQQMQGMWYLDGGGPEDSLLLCPAGTRW